MDAGGAGYVETWLVSYTGKYDEVAMLYNTVGLPTYLSIKSNDANVYCSKVEVDVADGDYYGVATTDVSIVAYVVTWSQKSITFDQNPLNRPAKISWGGSDITETVSQDISGSAIKNSAGDLYQPLPERPIRGGECTITRNELANPASHCVNYSYTTNSATWYGTSAGNAMIGKITANKMVEIYNGSSFTFWEVSYPLRFRRDGWSLKLIDNGFRKLVSGHAQVSADKLGQTTPTPILLDGSGGELAVGGTPVIYPLSGYQITEQSNFSSLDLPNPFA